MALLWLVTIVPLAAQTPTQSPTATEVFRRFASQVARVEIVEAGSGTKVTVGSAFFVRGPGLLVTNFHVVADLLYDPDRYSARLTNSGAVVAQDVSVEGFDVVHDLAVLRVAGEGAGAFTPHTAEIPIGSRLYALGFPADIGLSIVEGTYNGLLAHTLHPRVHFTGSLNPGMSGGPAITEDGALVGVNVSTAGNQISFLVPVRRVLDLVARVTAPTYTAPDDPIAELGRQLHDHQSAYVGALLADSVTSVVLGPYRVPSGTPELFECWGDSFDRDEERYEQVEHQCSSGDDVYLARGFSSGILNVHHQLVRAGALNRMQRSALHTELYQSAFSDFDFLTNDEMTARRCGESNVQSGDLILRVAFCAQRYERFDGLYDVTIRTAVLGAPDDGLISTVRLSGIDFPNARALMGRYVEGIGWN